MKKTTRATHCTATLNGHANVAKVLLQAGANKNIQNKECQTPAELARKFCNSNVAKLIENYKNPTS